MKKSPAVSWKCIHFSFRKPIHFHHLIHHIKRRVYGGGVCMRDHVCAKCATHT